MTKHYCLLLLTVLLSFHSSHAQFTIDAQLRPRTEFRNGSKELNDPDVEPALYTEQRTRLYVGFMQDKYEIKVTVQDVRMWGTTSQPYKADPNNSVHLSEAWGMYHFSDDFSFKMGRMPIAYHNERFFGASNWQPQGRSHDALLLMYHKNDLGLKADLGLAFNQNGFEPTLVQSTFYTGIVNYKYMQYIWLTKDFDKLSVNAMFVNNGYQQAADSVTANLQNYAVMLDYKINDKLQLGGEAYYQGGKNVVNADVSATMLGGYLTYKTDFAPFTLGVDYMSGTGYGSTSDHSFTPLFGSNHKFYGYMDYFYLANPHRLQGETYGTGLVDIYLLSDWKLNENWALKVNLHEFLSPVDIVDVNDVSRQYSSTLGTEVDLVMAWKLDKAVTINLGYSQMFATESMEQIKGFVTGYNGDASAWNNWAWLMVDFHPQLFKSEKNN
ncbi:alginate export family protein [Reichenbachiella agarivorans]|uniref:Alginate export family protein n=1 Tax=Reichenbachiella agarivorans TaxID=2979464 RepID=A0ABY6CJW5_9BACT|nr:alginate export family protein [Reichenbachiella agarivorans]UXP30815.1 alginate export family protein [Reichenbachiella agarivorans]